MLTPNCLEQGSRYCLEKCCCHQGPILFLRKFILLGSTKQVFYQGGLHSFHTFLASPFFHD